jgi:acetyl esterase/lipase
VAEVEIRKDVEFVSHAGEALAGTLYLPKAPGKYPALIAVHGGGWRLSNRDNYQHLGAWLAARGYVVFAVTHRLSKPGRKAFPEAVQDVRAAVQFVKARAETLKADPERVALMGESSGGHLAALVALAGEHALFREGNAADPHGRVSTAVKVCVPIYAVLDLARQWRHDQLTRFDDHIVQQFLGAGLAEDRRLYFDASPISYVSNKNNATAFLVAWGTADDIVDHREQGEAFVEALKQARFFVRTVVVLDAPHFWVADPLDEPGSYPGFFAPRLLRFLQARL